MIGLGTWMTSVKSLLFSGDIKVVISDKDGQYDIDFQLPEKFKNVKIRTYDIVEVGDNTLKGKGEITMLPGKEIEAEVTFNGDKFVGELRIPFMKRTLELKNGHKLSD